MALHNRTSKPKIKTQINKTRGQVNSLNNNSKNNRINNNNNNRNKGSKAIKTNRDQPAQIKTSNKLLITKLDPRTQITTRLKIKEIIITILKASKAECLQTNSNNNNQINKCLLKVLRDWVKLQLSRKKNYQVNSRRI